MDGAEGRGMSLSICAIGCSHGRHDQLVLPKADVLVHTGDFSRRGDESDAREFLKWLESQPHKHRIAVAGNHDRLSFTDPARFAQLVAEYAPSCHYLCDSGVEIEGVRFHGAPWTPRFLKWYWMAERGEAIQAHWDKIPTDTQVLVTHGPAMGHLDLIMPAMGEVGDYHQGCANLRLTIDERLHKLQAHLFSHLHYQGCMTKVEKGVTYINAAVVDDGYSIRGQIQVVEINP